ncbi:MAG: 6-phosphofructokinase [Elusimicrobia bacterium RIFCSPLOWO2_01_FULL_64_13]|nr:MAG: 6-phosphofructokinase [Elusimicrobia bacterium RIFCSPLOWO2_01_FULL_64_13]
MAIKSKVRKIGILTGGGDAPGLNAVIRAAVHSAHQRGWEVVGIREGFEGLLKPGLARTLLREDVAGILRTGGTILGTTNRGNPFDYPAGAKGRPNRDLSGLAVKNFRKMGLGALIAIGGDGSLSIAQKLYRKGLPVVGVPKTIDNDLSETVVTFGFDTAVSTATDALDKLHSTAQSHQRVMVIEVMGRYAGWIALHSGIAGNADVILIPEIPFTLESVCAKIKERYRYGPKFAIVVAAEGAAPRGEGLITKGKKESGREHPRLGGVAEFLSREIQSRTGRESRSLVLGHLQRGGEPTTFDRLLATRLGTAAVDLVDQGRFGQMTALKPPNIVAVPIARAIAKMKRVHPGSDVVRSARSLGISFGD